VVIKRDIMKEIELSGLEIHELANLSPKMTDVQYKSLVDSIKENGQLEPILLFKGKVIDGRHRVKALRELGSKTIKYRGLPPKTTYEEARAIVLATETRRHQTPTQKAIFAVYEYNKRKEQGIKVKKTELAKEFGVSRRNLARAFSLEEYIPKDIMDLLFNGKKINIGTKSNPLMTDSINAILSHYKKQVSEKKVESLMYDPADLTDDEVSFINDKYSEIVTTMTGHMLKALTDRLYAKLKEEE
jgi:ParB/RepB/Spo0J family partition protein